MARINYSGVAASPPAASRGVEECTILHLACELQLTVMLPIPWSSWARPLAGLTVARIAGDAAGGGAAAMS